MRRGLPVFMSYSDLPFLIPLLKSLFSYYRSFNFYTMLIHSINTQMYIHVHITCTLHIMCNVYASINNVSLVNEVYPPRLTGTRNNICVAQMLTCAF